MELIDTHAHLMEPRLFSQLEELLTRAVGAGVSQVVVVGTTLADSVAGVAACRGRVGLFPTAGIHPNSRPQHQYQCLQSIGVPEYDECAQRSHREQRLPQR